MQRSSEGPRLGIGVAWLLALMVMADLQLRRDYWKLLRKMLRRGFEKSNLLRSLRMGLRRLDLIEALRQIGSLQY